MPDLEQWDWWPAEEWAAASATGAPPAAAGPPAPPVPFPQVPADAEIALLVDGAWMDVTSDVYGGERSQVALRRGRTNEVSLVEHTNLTATLDNRTGRYAPRNPRSDLFGKIGRNTQIRASIRPHLQTGSGPDVVDTFGRTVPDTNWGVSDSGKSWLAVDLFTPVGARTQPSVDGAAGNFAINTNSQANGVYLAECSWVDTELVCSFTAPVPTGGDICGLGVASHVSVDGSSTGPYIEVVVTRVAGKVVIRGFTAASGPLGDSGFVAGLVHSGQKLRARFRTAGPHLMARVWDPSGAEPAVWHLAVVDGSAYDPGGLAVFGRALAGNTNAKPLLISYDDLAVTAVEPRATCEISSWPQRWTQGQLDAWVAVEAAGLLRRLAQGTAPARSPMERHVRHQATPPSAYWPLEDGRLAIQGAPVFGTHPMGIFPRASGGMTTVSRDQYLGSGSLAVWLPPCLALHGIDGATGAVSMPTFGDSWAVDWMRAGHGDMATELQINIYAGAPTTGAPFGSQQWVVQATPSTPSVTIDPPGVGSTTTGVAATLFDGSPHHWRFEAAQSGANMAWALYIDAVLISSGTVVALSPQAVVLIDIQDLAEHPDSLLSLGHVVVWDRAPDLAFGSPPPAVALSSAAARGHAGEPAAVRIARLCAEEGIILRVPGPPGTDLTTSFPCGVQRAAPALDLIRAAEATDGGLLYEPRDFLGLAYRMSRQFYSRPAALALEYSGAGHVAWPLEAVDDDQLVRNDWTVRRRFGGSTRAELAAGPLSTQPPPNGVGRYDTTVDLDLDVDTATSDQAQWRLHLGTVDESRLPGINLNLASLVNYGNTDRWFAAYRLDVGDRVTIAHPPALLPPRPISQLTQGYVEVLANFRWALEMNTAPASPWAIATVESGDQFCFRLETDGSTLAAAATDVAVALSVASTGALWTVSAANPADFPFDVEIAGLRITVTAITGSASPQTFTVVRSVDGFDLPLTAGATVRLWNRVYLGLG